MAIESTYDINNAEYNQTGIEDIENGRSDSHDFIESKNRHYVHNYKYNNKTCKAWNFTLKERFKKEVCINYSECGRGRDTSKRYTQTHK